MTRSPTRISDHVGREYLLVSANEVEHWSYATARQNLLEVLRDGMGAADVRRVAEQCGYTGDASDVEAIAACVAEAIASGRFVPVSVPDPIPRGRPVLALDGRTDDWDSAVPLSSLSTRERSDTETLAIEVRTDQGQPVAGVAYEVRLADGRVASGRLDARGRLRIEDVGRGIHHVRLIDVDALEWGAREIADRPVSPPPPFEGIVEPVPPEADEVDDTVPEYLEHRDIDVLDDDPGEAPTTVAVHLRTTDGAPLADARVLIDHGGGLIDEYVTDASGDANAYDWTAGAGTLTIGVETPVRFPLRATEVSPTSSIEGTISTSRAPVVVAARPYLTLAVARPTAYRTRIGGWPFDARLLLPVDIDAPVGKRTQPLNVVAGIFALCGERPSWGLLAVGHTDATGAADFNLALGALRAKSVHLYLTGDRTAWASHALAQASVRDLQVVLAWLATESLLPCHPGPIDGDFGPCTADAVAAWRIVRGARDMLTPSWPLPIEDWEAVFDSYDEWVETSSTRNLLGVRPSLAGHAHAWSRGEHEPSSTGRARRVELLLTPEALPEDLGAGDGFTDAADYVYRTHEFEDIEPAPIDESVVPYTGVVRKVAERGLRWLARGGVTVSHHVMVRHIVKRLIWLEKSRFRSGVNVRKLCEQTLKSADRVTDQGSKLVFEKTFDRVVGTAGERIVRVVVRKGSGRIITAFPELAFKAAVHPMAGVISIVAATTIHARWERYLEEQGRLEEAREGWITEVADFFVGPATIARDEDYVVFEQIVNEETALAVVSFEESVRREDGMFRTMSDDERSEFASSVTEELAALSSWSIDDGDAGADETDGGDP